MIEFSVNVAEVKGYIKGLVEATGKFFSMIRYNVRESVGQLFYTTSVKNACLHRLFGYYF